MKTPLLKPYDSFVHLIVLLLIGFVSVGLFMALGNTLVQLIWGIDVFSNMAVLTDYSRPEVIHANKLLLLLQHIGLFVLPSLVFAQLVARNVWSYLSVRKPLDQSHWVWAILAMFFSLLPINLLVEWNAALQLPESLEWLEEIIQSADAQAAALTEALLSDTSVGALLVNILLIAVVPAVGEELMFRGGIQRILAQWSGNIHVGIWVSALLFSAMHFQFYGFLPRMALGALFGYMLVWSGSIWLPILAHLINNATAVTLHFFIAQGVADESVDTVGTGSEGIYFTVVSAILLAGVIWKWQGQSKWPSIKERYLKT